MIRKLTLINYQFTNNHPIKNVLPIVALLALTSFSFFANAENISNNDRTLVIVTDNNSQLTSLSSKEVRRLYLGFNVMKNNIHITPIRNHSSDMLHEVFLQKVMFMSSRTYERQLNLRKMRKGLKPPITINTDKEIIEILVSNKNSITYMHKNQANKIATIRILKIR